MSLSPVPPAPRRRRGRWPAALAVVVALGLPACSGGAGTSGVTVADGGPVQLDPDATLRYVFVQNVSTFDPHKSGNAWDMVNLRLVYDQLLQETEEGELAPMLATRWEFTEGGKALEMTLRDDVVFTDGTPFDAAAVKANLDRARTLEGGTLKGGLKAVAGVEVVAPHRVRLRLAGPGGQLPAMFTERYGSMISPAALDNPDLDQEPVGSGMFTMEEYVPGQVTRYAKNPRYWDPEAVKVAKVETYVQTASPTRLNMLRTGQADMTYLLPQEGAAAEAAGLNVAPSKSTTIFRWYMNSGRKPFDDYRVRQAVEHAIDREALVEGVMFGMGEPVAQHIPPGHWAYHPDVTPDNPDYAYDPEKARALLAEAGYPDGFEFDFIVVALDDHRAVSEAIVPMLEKVGIRAKTRVIEPATAAITFYGRQEGNAFVGAGAPFVDPNPQYESNLEGQFSNPWKTVSAGFTQAWNDALVGETREERLPAVHRFIEEEKALRRQFPLFAAEPPSAWTKKVVFPEGYEPRYAPHFRGVGIAE